MSYTRQTLRLFWSAAKQYPFHLVIIGGGMLLASFVDVLKPFTAKYLFETLQYQPGNTELLFFWFGMLIGAGVLRMVIFRILEKYNNFFQPRVITNLMQQCFAYLIHHSQRFFSDQHTGALQNKVRKFAYGFETVADQITFELIRSCILLLLLALLTIIFYWQVGLIIIIWLCMYLFITYKLTMWKFPIDETHATIETKFHSGLADLFVNNAVITFFGSRKHETNSCAVNAEELFQAKKRSWDYGWYINVFQGMAMVLLEIGVMLYAIVQYQAAVYSLGDIVLLQAYLGRVFDNTWSMGRFIRHLYEKLADANEMTELLSLPHEITNPVQASALQLQRGKVEFKNVVFRYTDTQLPVLNKLSFTVPAGKKIALVGPSGGGKSTIAKLLLRAYDPTAGSICIDGQDIRSITDESLRQAVVPVLQDTTLFCKSIYENIAYGKPNAPYSEVLEAARRAHCHEFIEALAQEYHTIVGERGLKLSGGQRQRVAIARAFLKNSPILILDEATSSLDSESEHYIQESLSELMAERTAIIIAHRLSTIKEADHILVIEGGCLTAEGTHNFLLENSTLYKKLWELNIDGYLSQAYA